MLLTLCAALSLLAPPTGRELVLSSAEDGESCRARSELAEELRLMLDGWQVRDDPGLLVGAEGPWAEQMDRLRELMQSRRADALAWLMRQDGRLRVSLLTGIGPSALVRQLEAQTHEGGLRELALSLREQLDAAFAPPLPAESAPKPPPAQRPSAFVPQARLELWQGLGGTIGPSLRSGVAGALELRHPPTGFFGALVGRLIGGPMQQRDPELLAGAVASGLELGKAILSTRSVEIGALAGVTAEWQWLRLRSEGRTQAFSLTGLVGEIGLRALAAADGRLAATVSVRGHSTSLTVHRRSDASTLIATPRSELGISVAYLWP